MCWLSCLLACLLFSFSLSHFLFLSLSLSLSPAFSSSSSGVLEIVPEWSQAVSQNTRTLATKRTLLSGRLLQSLIRGGSSTKLHASVTVSKRNLAIFQILSGRNHMCPIPKRIVLPTSETPILRPDSRKQADGTEGPVHQSSILQETSKLSSHRALCEKSILLVVSWSSGSAPQQPCLMPTACP